MRPHDVSYCIYGSRSDNGLLCSLISMKQDGQDEGNKLCSTGDVKAIEHARQVNRWDSDMVER
jgi:hypothetical protein